MKKKITYFILATLAILVGGLMFVYAGIDDSPGGQLLGVIVAIGGVVSIVRNKRKV